MGRKHCVSQGRQKVSLCGNGLIESPLSTIRKSPFLILPASFYQLFQELKKKKLSFVIFLSEIDSENNINMNMRDPFGSTQTCAFRVVEDL